MSIRWILFTLVFLGALAPAVSRAAPRVVINEIHFDPADKRPLEFVELHNTTAGEVKLSGWTLEKFSFPADTGIAAGDFVVVAQDPTAFAKEFGFQPLGPLPGKLSNCGEKITLRDSGGKVVDELKYGVGFPWPTAANGAGPSLERIHPQLPSADNDPAGRPAKRNPAGPATGLAFYA